ncbi:MAG: citramalate synthase [Deltaproteobacteria bacterium RBG_19FT_COMBO_52_11]|nr:MAG: citramalate synthase [Deltaproteobacteria bacterium RBG_19FT_COMBO_52_11]
MNPKKGISRKIKVYDTTLRDGTQAEDVAFSVEDKVRIATRLDDLGIDYIEGGWPGSNPKDMAFFREIRNYSLKKAVVAAFGSTARARTAPENDANLKAILGAKTRVVTIFGKSWDVHVRDALRIPLEQNITLIRDSLKFLKASVPEVIYDAEHFFDGFKGKPDYALATLKAAQEAKVDIIVLCDTNGGTIPSQLTEIIHTVQSQISIPLGIHAHNDSEMAVANTIAAVELGIGHVQGTINGYGERCGNANLCSILPNLRFKLKLDCLNEAQMAKLREVSHFVAELANLQPNKHQPYVGLSAFAHKGGVHVSAIEKNPMTYEHLPPEWVGNRRRILISDLAGKSNVLQKAADYHIDLGRKDPLTDEILNTLKEMENQGFQYEGAEASFELLMKKALGTQKKYFELLGFRILSEKLREDRAAVSEATIMVKVGGRVEHTAATGNGPVNALDNAIRKALEKFYPQLGDMELVDYKVRVLSTGKGTASRVRVLIESGDRRDKWGTVGVSENIIEASWQALVDSINYKLLKDEKDGT